MLKIAERAVANEAAETIAHALRTPARLLCPGRIVDQVDWRAPGLRKSTAARRAAEKIEKNSTVPVRTGMMEYRTDVAFANPSEMPAFPSASAEARCEPPNRKKRKTQSWQKEPQNAACIDHRRRRVMSKSKLQKNACGRENCAGPPRLGRHHGKLAVRGAAGCRRRGQGMEFDRYDGHAAGARFHHDAGLRRQDRHRRRLQGQDRSALFRLHLLSGRLPDHSAQHRRTC